LLHTVVNETHKVNKICLTGRHNTSSALTNTRIKNKK